MTVLGLNLRNNIIARNNPRPAIRLVNDKYGTKVRLAEYQVPVPGTINLIEDQRQLQALDWDSLPDSWALKPNRGRRGEGIMLAVERKGADWATASGRVLTKDDIRYHAERVLDGEYSLEGLDRDSAMFEPLIRPHPLLKEIVPEGLPDCRIICLGDEPLMAMMRIPTRASDGKANLHQGAIGAGIEMDSGIIFRAVLGDGTVTHHPDTGYELIGLQVPLWDEILAASTRCGEALGLGYVGADIVIDQERGPLVLECNAFPGLQIQNVNAAGLKKRIDDAGLHPRRFWTRFRRSQKKHSHVTTKEQFSRTLGRKPLHRGYSSMEAVESMDGRQVFNMFSNFQSIDAAPSVDPVLAEAARSALLHGEWDDRGSGANGAMIIVTTVDPIVAIIGRIRQGEGGRPMFEISEVSQIARRASGVTPKRGRKHILVCDDDDLLAEIVRAELLDSGYKATIAGNGEQALSQATAILPDAIVLDGDMPLMDGFEVLRHVRSNPNTAGIPVIMLTARKHASQIINALDIGADEYITKPFTSGEVVARLNRIFAADIAAAHAVAVNEFA